MPVQMWPIQISSETAFSLGCVHVLFLLQNVLTPNTRCFSTLLFPQLQGVVKSKNSGARLPELTFWLCCCVTLGKLIILYKPQFTCL